jgi:two-component sensor histidine kinase
MSAHETVIQFPKSRAAAYDAYEHETLEAVTTALQAALEREKILREEIGDLLRRQDTSGQEFEHRLANSLEVIANMLLSQGQAASTPEAAVQLSITARRIAAERLRHRLNLHDR